MTDPLENADESAPVADSRGDEPPGERAAAIEGFKELTKKADERVRESTAAAQKTLASTDLPGWSAPGRLS